MPFSRETLDFLFENRLHDSRTWFAEHRDSYQAFVLEPLRELVQDLSPLMLQLDPQFVTEPKVDKTICRIWRDTRYTRDPSLYRDHMWITFKRGGKMNGTDYPGMYVGIGSYGFDYGCGFYHASTGYMETLRTMILENDPAYRKAQKALDGQSSFHLEGDTFKRPRYSQYPPAKRNWLERRGISINGESKNFELMFSPALADFLKEEFQLIFPIYRFLLLAAEKELCRQTASALSQR